MPQFPTNEAKEVVKMVNLPNLNLLSLVHIWAREPGPTKSSEISGKKWYCLHI